MVSEDTSDVKRQDLRSFNVLVSTVLQNVGELGVGAAAEGIPQNFKRYVYYYRAVAVDQLLIGTIYENLGGVLTPKDTFMLTPMSGVQPQLQVPGGGIPDPERPILEFRQSGFIAVQTSALAGSGRALLTFGFYDAPPR